MGRAITTERLLVCAAESMVGTDMRHWDKRRLAAVIEGANAWGDAGGNGCVDRKRRQAWRPDQSRRSGQVTYSRDCQGEFEDVNR